MRRAVVLLVLALSACSSSGTNVPAGQYGDATQQPGEAVIVGSLSTLGLTGVADGRRLHFTFRAYDPATGRLIPNGPAFEIVRETCRADGPQCDPSQPLHQVVTLPPGHYVLTATHLLGDVTPLPSSQSATHFYVPVDVNFWGMSLDDDAALENTETVEIEVGPGEVVYFGALSVDRPDSDREKRYYAMVFDVERDDAAATAALEAAGIGASAMIWRPAT
ncbi:MAG TPA: hypothetical protein VJL84_01525 [Kiloniellales bacterium]|nr:hypothetical protein [Kiloniellales bacterium]